MYGRDRMIKALSQKVGLNLLDTEKNFGWLVTTLISVGFGDVTAARADFAVSANRVLVDERESFARSLESLRTELDSCRLSLEKADNLCDIYADATKQLRAAVLALHCGNTAGRWCSCGELWPCETARAVEDEPKPMLRGKTAVETCRLNGWVAGTRLAGDENQKTTVIKITAIGQENILATRISHNGVPNLGREISWSLNYREWTKVTESEGQQ